MRRTILNYIQGKYDAENETYYGIEWNDNSYVPVEYDVAREWVIRRGNAYIAPRSYLAEYKASCAVLSIMDGIFIRRKTDGPGRTHDVIVDLYDFKLKKLKATVNCSEAVGSGYVVVKATDVIKYDDDNFIIAMLVSSTNNLHKANGVAFVSLNIRNNATKLINTIFLDTTVSNCVLESIYMVDVFCPCPDGKYKMNNCCELYRYGIIADSIDKMSMAQIAFEVVDDESRVNPFSSYDKASVIGTELNSPDLLEVKYSKEDQTLTISTAEKTILYEANHEYRMNKEERAEQKKKAEYEARHSHGTVTMTRGGIGSRIASMIFLAVFVVIAALFFGIFKSHPIVPIIYVSMCIAASAYYLLKGLYFRISYDGIGLSLREFIYGRNYYTYEQISKIELEGETVFNQKMQVYDEDDYPIFKIDSDFEGYEAFEKTIWTIIKMLRTEQLKERDHKREKKGRRIKSFRTGKKPDNINKLGKFW